MDNYNFLADLMDTFQSSPDWIKAVWLMAVPGFLLGVLALILNYRLEARRLESEQSRYMAGGVIRDDAGRFHFYTHGEPPHDELPPQFQSGSEAAVLPLALHRPPQGGKPRSEGF